MEESLKIYGSYQDTFNESVMGHNNTKYIVGGNSRYNLRNNTIEFESLKAADLDVGIKIKQINTLLRLNPYILDMEELCQYLNTVLEKPTHEIISFLENSLNLKEPINIVLRKLFYILIKYDTMDQTRVEFCKLEPVVRTKKLVDSLNDLNIPILSKHMDNLEKCYQEIDEYICEKSLLIKSTNDKNDNDLSHILVENKGDTIDPYTSPFITENDSEDAIDTEDNIILTASPFIMEEQHDIDKILDHFIDIYKKTYPVLERVEIINVKISKVLEKMCNILHN